MIVRTSLAFVVLTVGAGLFSAQNALAGESPRYTYVEGGWQHLDLTGVNYLDGGDTNGDGFFGGGSYAINDLFHAFASYGGANLDTSGGDVDLTELNVGGGVRYPATDTIDIVGRLSYVDVNADPSDGGSDSDTGYRIEAGVRGMATPVIELDGGLSYDSVGNSSPSDSVAVKVAALYSVTDWLAAGVGGSFSGEAKTYGVTVRAYFGGR